MIKSYKDAGELAVQVLSNLNFKSYTNRAELNKIVKNNDLFILNDVNGNDEYFLAYCTDTYNFYIVDVVNVKYNCVSKPYIFEGLKRLTCVLQDVVFEIEDGELFIHADGSDLYYNIVALTGIDGMIFCKCKDNNVVGISNLHWNKRVF